ATQRRFPVPTPISDLSEQSQIANCLPTSFAGSSQGKTVRYRDLVHSRPVVQEKPDVESAHLPT
ncbi:hypothetical protein JMJ77_0014624, partial [Colletotrichum scovillei]